MRTGGSVAILMATYNGAKALPMQLESFAMQSLKPVSLMVSDDGSVDGSREVVRRWAAAHADIETRLIDGPCRGAAQNFLALLRLPLHSDFVAISDQDDIWLPEKLQTAVAALCRLPPDRPALYCGRTWEVSENLSRKRLSRGAPRPPGFAHALVQNIAGGNTMVLNRAASEIIRQAALLTEDVVIHDWWIYQVISGIGGTVLFDETPHLLYRQHADNVIGANRGLAATLVRAHMLVTGRFSDWCARNVAALRGIEAWFTPESRALLDSFDAARRQPPLQSLATIRRAGFYRQGLRGQISLYLAALLGRI